MKSRIIIIALIVLGSAAVIANLYNLNNNGPSVETQLKTAILDEVERCIAQGYLHSPGALPISHQLEELRKKMESGKYLFAQGRAFGETLIAAQNHAFEIAKKGLLEQHAENSSYIETVFQCSLEKEQGIDVFLILAVMK